MSEEKRVSAVAVASGAVRITQPKRLTVVIADAIATLVERLGHATRVRRDIRRLHAMDDRLLHDIGVSRGEIEDAVLHGRVPRRSRQTAQRELSATDSRQYDGPSIDRDAYRLEVTWRRR